MCVRLRYAMPERCGRGFYARDTITVARALLGEMLFHDTPVGRRSGRIVEVEAYRGISDPASHAFRGPTRRSRIMFGTPGYLYVYFIYGMYHCCNVVTERRGEAGAVLIRGLVPIDGIARMRDANPHLSPRRLADGPGKVCRALGITLAHNGVDLAHGRIGIIPLPKARDQEIVAGPRIGITRGMDLPYRFHLRDWATASGKVRGPASA